MKPNIEDRITKIEGLLEEVLAILVSGQQPGKYEYERALQQFARGNRKPLEAYIKRGGKPHGGNREELPAEERR
jgi:hypothetical protein